MDTKKKDDEIIELTEEELDEIFADEDFEGDDSSKEVRSFIFSIPDSYAKPCLCQMMMLSYIP